MEIKFPTRREIENKRMKKFFERMKTDKVTDNWLGFRYDWGVEILKKQVGTSSFYADAWILSTLHEIIDQKLLKDSKPVKEDFEGFLVDSQRDIASLCLFYSAASIYEFDNDTKEVIKEKVNQNIDKYFSNEKSVLNFAPSPEFMFSIFKGAECLTEENYELLKKEIRHLEEKDFYKSEKRRFYAIASLFEIGDESKAKKKLLETLHIKSIDELTDEELILLSWIFSEYYHKLDSSEELLNFRDEVMTKFKERPFGDITNLSISGLCQLISTTHDTISGEYYFVKKGEESDRFLENNIKGKYHITIGLCLTAIYGTLFIFARNMLIEIISQTGFIVGSTLFIILLPLILIIDGMWRIIKNKPHKSYEETIGRLLRFIK
ncbi:hypothetical protein AKJ49_00345 [candidate division MSBL1 archaeon SCGC-AAA382A03]|uniref:Uncharacterized protein n=1 Tax=candidate division MSBL1 archaeon SCGC-AAA382A03 TaxID=1698278 RepID=A0A133VGV4_9EURY|nr:hypothetical protein AKJ49_00345 [candidate division MSBL1 archaeon SCGC-AAA382A03]